jgi:5-methylcytosine-specific restriction endonuclease McrA
MVGKGKPGPPRKYNDFVTIVCLACKQSFAWRDVPFWPRQKYCSRACYLEAIKNVPKEFVCASCGITFYRKTKPSRPIPKYCSRACYHAQTRGSNHHNWQGGHDHYYGPNWEVARAAALARDQHVCQHCGIIDKQPNVHHIVSRRNFENDWDSANSLDNLITLCTPCHARLHALEDSHFVQSV